MFGYETREQDVRVGGLSFRLKTLKDRNQYFDPDKKAENAGVSPSNWPLFGQLWPASRVLAKAVKSITIENKRILELGCGLALPSLVLKQRGADITASDRHPMSRQFLQKNMALNNSAHIPFESISWNDPAPELGRFHTIIASDVLYEQNHADLLAHAIEKLAMPKAKMLLTCPGRGYKNRFAHLMKAQGFDLEEQRLAFNEEETAPFKGRLMIFTR